MAYEQIKHIMMPTKDLQTPIRNMIAGSLAGEFLLLLAFGRVVLCWYEQDAVCGGMDRLAVFGLV